MDKQRDSCHNGPENIQTKSLEMGIAKNRGMGSMEHDKVRCAYCNRDAALMRSHDKTIVICTNCGISIELETYRELFDTSIRMIPKERDEK